MTHTAARVHLTQLAVLCFLAASLPTHAHAQVLRGTVKAKGSGALLVRAQVVARSDSGIDIGATSTDERGRFQLVLKTLGRPFNITVRQLGIALTKSDDIRMAPSDTADLELLVEETSTAPLDTFTVKSVPSRNDMALADAERRGWKLFTPKEVELHRTSARTVQDLLRSWGNAGLQFNSRTSDCVQSMRNNECLDWVIDGQPVGTSVHMDPRQIYFVALVNRTEAMNQWGNKTPNGAIVIYTRMNGDKIR